MMSPQAEPLPRSPQVRLDYAPAPPRRRKFIRRAAAMILIAVVVLAALRWGPSMRDRVILLYVQHRCMNFAPPPDKVVYEEQPAAAAKLLANGSEYAPYPINRSHPPSPAAAVKAAARVPAYWLRMRSSLNPPISTMSPGAPSAVMFMHERISPSGHRRLVCIYCFPDTHSFIRQFIEGYNYQADVIAPATLKTNAKIIPRFWAIDVLSGYPVEPPNLRIYAGQIDQQDASKFTIRYEMWGKTDVLDGQLLDNDQVKLVPRHTPDWPR